MEPSHGATIRILCLAALCSMVTISSGSLDHAVNFTETILQLHILGNITDTPGSLTRMFLSQAHIEAAKQIQEWMSEAGMRTWIDAVGNVHGRVDGHYPDDAAGIVFGSHYDTVVDAGKYDGALGIISAISAVKAILSKHDFEENPGGPFALPVEVIAFSDEDGARFQTTFLGSRAIAGSLIQNDFTNVLDASGISLASVLEKNGYTDDVADDISIPPGKLKAYVEVHTEQGPRLRKIGSPLGVVAEIAGQTFLKVTILGDQNHAGTVPMQMRKDALAGAAEVITKIERLCSTIDSDLRTETPTLKQECSFEGSFHHEACFTFVGDNSLLSIVNQIQKPRGMLVCTVGQLDVRPGSFNAIAGAVVISVDIRSGSDTERNAAVKVVTQSINEICNRRELRCSVAKRHEANAVKCSSRITQLLADAAQESIKETAEMIESTSISELDTIWGCTNSRQGDCTLWNSQHDVPSLVSGAGHDGLAIAEISPIGMVFVRDNGISHSPDEEVDAWDIGAAVLTIVKYLEKEAMSRM